MLSRNTHFNFIQFVVLLGFLLVLLFNFFNLSVLLAGGMRVGEKEREKKCSNRFLRNMETSEPLYEQL